MNKQRKRQNSEQFVRKLRDADAMLNAGKDVASVLLFLEVSESNYLRWRNQFGGMKSAEARRLKQLEYQNKRSSSSSLTDAKKSSASAFQSGRLCTPRSSVASMTPFSSCSYPRKCPNS